MELEKAGFQVKNVRTNRPRINLNDVVLPYVKVERPEFNEVLNWLRAQQITETKGVFKNLKANMTVLNSFSVLAVFTGRFVRTFLTWKPAFSSSMRM